MEPRVAGNTGRGGGENRGTRARRDGDGGEEEGAGNPRAGVIT